MGSFDVLNGIIGKGSIPKEAIENLEGKQILFKPTGQKDYRLEVSGGKISVNQEGSTSPSVTISGQDEVLSDVFTGKLNAISAFMSGKIKVSGDVMLAQSLVSVLKK